MRKRILVLPAAALILIALVVYKQTRKPAPQGRVELPAAQAPAPLFSLLTRNNKLVKFERYVGRHKILVVFFDGAAVADTLALSADGETALPDETVKQRLAGR